MSKYKEFWICPEIGEIKLKKSNTWPSEQYHVIEYSAYEQAHKDIDLWQDKTYHATRRVEELEQGIKALVSSSEGLLEKIQSLKEENKLLKEALIEAQNEIENLKREMDQVKHLANTWFDQNKLLKEALKFYAHSDNWNHINTKTATYAIIDEQDLGDGSFQFNDITDDERVGGKLARQTLKKIGEL